MSLYSGWLYKRTLTLDTTIGGADISTTQSNFPILLRFTSANFDFDQADADGDDLRFTNNDEDTDLDFEIERWDNVSELGEVWVKVPSVTGNSTTSIKMFWGKSGAVNQSDGTAVFTSANDHVGVWHMNDNAANTAVKDATGNHDGVFNGNTNLHDASGIIAGALNFDGSSDYITVDHHADFTAVDGATISAWIYNENNTSTWRCVIEKNRGAGAEAQTQGLWRNNFKNWTGFASNSGEVSTTSFASVNGWDHVAYTYSVGGTARIYLNGSSQATANIDANKPADGTEDVHIGAMDNGSAMAEFFDGLIDEIRWDSTPRSADWIKLCFENQQASDSLVTYGTVIQRGGTLINSGIVKDGLVNGRLIA